MKKERKINKDLYPTKWKEFVDEVGEVDAIYG